MNLPEWAVAGIVNFEVLGDLGTALVEVAAA
jgi:hypothetical protein